MRGAFAFLFMLIAATAGSEQQQNQAVPDAPTLQKTASLLNMKSEVALGIGDAVNPSNNEQPPKIQTLINVSQEPRQQLPEEQRSDALNPQEFNFIAVAVKDKSGQLVSGLTYRDFSLFENGQQKLLRLFTADPSPLSVVFVLDENTPADIKQMIEGSIDAMGSALARGDEAAFVLYNRGQDRGTDFMGSESFHFPDGLQIHDDQDLPTPATGPQISTGIRVSPAGLQTLHTLNDAIFTAAQLLSSRPKDHRKIIYVVGDGKELGSKISTKEVIRYLQTSQVAVYATIVGEAAHWAESYRTEHIQHPYPASNVLARYVTTTGGSWDVALSTSDLERGYTEIAKEARTRYTLGYFTNESLIDGKYRSIDVRVQRPDLNVMAAQGYYPPVPAVK